MRLSSFRLASPAPAVLVCAALATAWPAAAQMYKWTDERGVVSYSNTPPPNTAQRKVESIEERVSVYTTDEETKRAISAEKQREARPPTPGSQLGSQRARDGRDSRDSRDGRDGRDSRDARAQAEASRNAADYQRCVEQRGVDCDTLRNGPSAAMDSGSGYGVGEGFVFLPAPVVVGARPVRPPPFVVGESPIPRIGVDNRPRVGISTAPPVGVSPPQPPIGSSAPLPQRPRTGR